MLFYQSRRHKTLMEESEQALWTAADLDTGIDARIAKQVLNDAKSHRLWESRHAELLRPVAEHGRRAPQVIALRDLEVRLIHRRALFDHIREHQVRGTARERLFHVFYGPRDYHDAVLAEHRQYMLAVSSRVSADHLLDVMHDPVSSQLLQEYETRYLEYFDLYCYVVASEDRDSADATKWLMAGARRQAEKLRRRITSVAPEKGAANFERQAMLARSGRYAVVNYME